MTLIGFDYTDKDRTLMNVADILRKRSTGELAFQSTSMYMFTGKELNSAFSSLYDMAFTLGVQSTTSDVDAKQPSDEPKKVKAVDYGNIFDVARVIPKINPYMKGVSEVEMLRRIKETVDGCVHEPDCSYVGTVGWTCIFDESDDTIYCNFTVRADMAEKKISELED